MAKEFHDILAELEAEFEKQIKEREDLCYLYQEVLDADDLLAKGETLPDKTKTATALWSHMIKQRIIAEVGLPLPGDNVKMMTDYDLDSALDDLQEERYYYRKSLRRGEVTDADRKSNLRMELWGMAARHENSKRYNTKANHSKCKK